jgi:hypothetical protein
MAKIKALEVDRRVGIALSVLPSVQTHLVERVTRSERSFATAAAIPGRVQQMANSGQPLYKMRVSPSLRLIYTMVGDAAYVVDIVERATLNRFAGRKAAEKAGKTQVTKLTMTPPKVAVKKAPSRQAGVRRASG